MAEHPPPQQVLDSLRLRLAPLVPADADEMEVLASDAAIADTTLSVPHPYPSGVGRRWIASIGSNWGNGISGVWSIRLRDGGALVGVIDMHLEPEADSAEIGYWIGVPFWGRGYATEAVRAIIDFGFATLGLNRIHAEHFPRNPASGRVMAKAGMVLEGTLRQAIRKGTAYEDLAVYAILREDWLRASRTARGRPTTERRP